MIERSAVRQEAKSTSIWKDLPVAGGWWIVHHVLHSHLCCRRFFDFFVYNNKNFKNVAQIFFRKMTDGGEGGDDDCDDSGRIEDGIAVEMMAKSNG